MNYCSAMLMLLTHYLLAAEIRVNPESLSAMLHGREYMPARIQRRLFAALALDAQDPDTVPQQIIKALDHQGG
jgi:hypothetical protein